jgi:hypothetical protein
MFAIRRILAAAALLAVAGCGSHHPAAAPSRADAPAADPAAVWNEFVACARVHGQQSWPDPDVQADGTATFGSFNAKSAMDAVRLPCGAILDKLPPAARPGQQTALHSPSAEHMAAMNAYAQCMRQNGFSDWPDVNPDGTFWLDDAFWTPEHRAKQEIAGPRCRHLLPSE